MMESRRENAREDLSEDREDLTEECKIGRGRGSRFGLVVRRYMLVIRRTSVGPASGGLPLNNNNKTKKKKNIMYIYHAHQRPERSNDTY